MNEKFIARMNEVVRGQTRVSISFPWLQFLDCPLNIIDDNLMVGVTVTLTARLRMVECVWLATLDINAFRSQESFGIRATFSP